MKTAVLTDSTAYIPVNIREEMNIHMVPLSVVFGNKTYREEVDISTDEFYQKMKETNELPKSSQPSYGTIMEKYEELEKTYDAVIAIHLSSGISGTFDAVASAGKMVENLKVYTFDSEMSAMALGLYVIEASRLANQGIDPEEILKRLAEMRQTMRAYFVVDDLTNLQRGGRLNNAQAFIGGVLQVKPILHFVDKKIVPYERIRTRKKAVARLEELFEEDAKTGRKLKGSVIHAQREEEAITIKNELESWYPNVELIVSYFGPVTGTHLGEGAIGLCWYMAD